MRARIDRMLRKAGLRPPIPAYIHVPKTGGTYLSQLESDGEPVIQPIRYLGHTAIVSRPGAPSFYPVEGFRSRVTHPKALLDDYFVVSTVRNPFSFLVSYWVHAGGLNPKYDDPTHYDYDNARKGFDYLMKTIASREAPWPSRKLIHFELFCDDGDLLVDWINRNETLDADLADLAVLLKLRYRRQPPQRVGTKGSYLDHYDDALSELVETTWGRELKLFGYTRTGSDPAKAVLGRRIDPAVKGAVKYWWDSDRLVVDGVEQETRVPGGSAAG